MDPTLYAYGRLVHIIGIVFWVGGVVTVALAAAMASEEARETAAGAFRKSIVAVASPAMIVAWVAGLTVLLAGWSEVYAKAGWMHGKVTLGLIITALTGVVSGRLRKASRGKAELKPGLMRGFALGILVLAFINVALAVLKPGS
jgi:putative membrane protein